jgi:hypothetical protein
MCADPTTAELSILKKLWDVATGIDEVKPSSAEFDLKRTLLGAGIAPSSSVFLNWYRFDDIDEVQLESASTFFHDFWYPSADDLEIFDDSLKWVLFVHHYDSLSVTLLE